MDEDIEKFQSDLMNAIYNSEKEIEVVILHPDMYWRMVQNNIVYRFHSGHDYMTFSTIIGKRLIRSNDVELEKFEIY